MKAITLALFLISSLGAFAADNSPAPAKTRVLPSKTHAQTVSKSRDADEQRSTAAPDDDLCYTMRVYMFEAKDGESPRPRGVETCVASNPRIMKKTAEPKAQFKLLK